MLCVGFRSGSGAEHVNLFRIIRRYVEPFARTQPKNAFHYLYLLRATTGSAGAASASASASASFFSTPSGKSTAASLLSPTPAKDSKAGDFDVPQAVRHCPASLPLPRACVTRSCTCGFVWAQKWNEQVYEAMVDLITETKEYDELIGSARDRAAKVHIPLCAPVRQPCAELPYV